MAKRITPSGSDTRVTGPRWGLVAYGIAVGLFTFLALFPATALLPEEIDWLRQGDWAQHFLGWHLFRREPWRSPVGGIRATFEPFGTNIAFMDSLPALSLPLKLLHRFLPDPFQFIGVWLCSCFILQGVISSLLLSRLTSNGLAVLSGALLLTASPILLFRVGHDTLCAHWLLLLSIFNLANPPARAFTARRAGPLFAALVHPYLAVMSVGLECTAHFFGSPTQKRSWVGRLARALAWAAFYSVSALLMWSAIGYFTLGSFSNYAGYKQDAFSFNLNGLVNPLGWSQLLSDLTLAQPEQYEGFAYLGLGGISLVAAALSALCISTEARRSFIRHGPLLIGFIPWVLVAAGPKAYFGRTPLYDLSATGIARVLEPFQSTGRFIWPVYYGTLLGSIWIISNARRQSVGMVCALAVILQGIDIGKKIAEERTRYQRLTVSPPAWIAADRWRCLPKEIHRLTVVPPRQCGETPVPYSDALFLVADHGLITNTGYAARSNNELLDRYCRKLSERISAGRFKSDAVYIVRPDHLYLFARAGLRCEERDGVHRCVVAERAAQWARCEQVSFVTSGVPR